MAEYYTDYDLDDEEQEQLRPPRPQFPPDNRFMKDIGRAFLIEKDHRHHPPYDMDSRNRFNPGNHYVGDIEDGKRYPFGVYTKEESDERYAVKATEEQVAALQATVAGKADEQECVNIRARLDALEYKSIQINSFSAAPPVLEIGSSQTITLAWTLNKQATSQNINGSPVTGNSKRFTDVTTPTTYMLSVSDGKTSASRSVSVSFANQIYYGAAENLDEVTALSKILSNDPERVITVDARANDYIIYAIPARLGTVKFFVGGFEGGFEEAVEQQLVNSSGYIELYKVYRSTNTNLGETVVEIKEG